MSRWGFSPKTFLKARSDFVSMIFIFLTKINTHDTYTKVFSQNMESIFSVIKEKNTYLIGV
jgi:hypothetical protein